MISYAGYPLGQHTPDMLERVRCYLDPAEVWSFAAPTLPPQGLAHLPWNPWRPEAVEIGCLVWPTGASRFAHAHYVLSGATMDLVRAAISDAEGTALTLTLDDGTRSITPAMYALPARPLYQAGTGEGELYLLTLVDDRYRWWYVGADIDVQEGSTTWTDLYDAIGAALGVTIQADAVASAYLLPSSDLTAHHQALPALLDAVAASCGQKLVRWPDGTVYALNATSARTIEDGNLDLATRLAGGTLALGV